MRLVLRMSILIAISLAAGMGCVHAQNASSSATEPDWITQRDHSKMAGYRTLAKFTYLAFERGQYATAAKLARTLDWCWDRGEGSHTPNGLEMRNAALFKEIDPAMDLFVEQISHYDETRKVPDAAKFRAAYDAYLEKLKLAD